MHHPFLRASMCLCGLVFGVFALTIPNIISVAAATTPSCTVQNPSVTWSPSGSGWDYVTIQSNSSCTGASARYYYVIYTSTGSFYHSSGSTYLVASTITAPPTIPSYQPPVGSSWMASVSIEGVSSTGSVVVAPVRSAKIPFTITSAPPPKPAPSWPVTYDFENGTNGWGVAWGNLGVATSTAQSYTATHSLAIAVPGGIAYPAVDNQVGPFTNLAALSTVYYEVWSPSASPVTVQPFVYDTNWSPHLGSSFGLNPGWNIISFIIPSGITGFKGVGLQVNNSNAWSGTIYLDSVGWAANPSPPPSPPPSPSLSYGVNRAGTEYACIQGWGYGDGPYDQTSINALLTWKVNTVRLPINQDCWIGQNAPSAYSGAGYRSFVTNYVHLLAANGIHTVIDLHWTAPGSQPATGQAPMADSDHSLAFWSSAAAAFANNSYVSFDAFNEPHDITNACYVNGCYITSSSFGAYQAIGMQQIINTIRATGAKNPIWISGNNWGNDLSAFPQLNDSAHNLVGSYHAYSGYGKTPQSYETLFAQYQSSTSYPLVLGESGEYDCTSTFVNPIYDYANQHNIGYLGWTWNNWSGMCGSGPTLITSYDGTPTAYGQGLHDHLLALAGSNKFA